MIHVLIRSGFSGLLPLGSHGSYIIIAMALRAKEQPRRTLAHTPKPSRFLDPLSCGGPFPRLFSHVCAATRFLPEMLKNVM